VISVDSALTRRGLGSNAARNAANRLERDLGRQDGVVEGVDTPNVALQHLAQLNILHSIVSEGLKGLAEVVRQDLVAGHQPISDVDCLLEASPHCVHRWVLGAWIRPHQRKLAQ
jgi:hypothetical protein